MNNELKKYIESVPAVADAAALRETFWLNEKKRPGKKLEYHRGVPGADKGCV